ncbi:MAG: ROK family protein [Candidatus Omnitrophica bacterium]|nr:ROK family protein [Candidatus Omnitrophota bacterium]
MRILLCSDIHANLPALLAVLKAAEKIPYDELWCLGDVVGYGPFPNECAEIIRKKASRIIYGNHDLKAVAPGIIARDAGDASRTYKDFVFDWTRAALTPGVRAFLKSLPSTIAVQVEGQRILLAHGSPLGVKDGIFADTSMVRLKALAQKFPVDAMLIGHTHDAFVRKAGKVTFINPGSIGRPFDADPAAAFMVLDITAKGVVAHRHRVAYDLSAVVDKMRAERFPDILVKAVAEARSPRELLINSLKDTAKEKLMQKQGEKYFIGIDVGGTKVFGGLVTPAGTIVAQHKEPTPPQAGLKDVLNIIAKIIGGLLKTGNASRKDVLGLGVAVPGVVDNAGKVVVTPNINLSGADLRKILEKKYKMRVAVGNDVNFGVLGEKWLGAGRKAKDIIGIFPGTGVGGGVIVKGNFLTGHQGAAAELGHMCIDPKGEECSCGNAGCLEAVVGRWAIERDIRAAVKKGEKTIITDLAGVKLVQIKSGTIAKALQSKDPVVTRIMTRAADTLAQACVSLNHVFNTEMFIFGGGLIEACGDFILPRIERALKKDPFFKNLQTPEVVAAKLGDDAVMLGAVAAVRQEVDLKVTGASYYPKLKFLPSGKLTVNGAVIEKPFYVRADGKLKDPEEFVPPHITYDLVDELTKKGPYALFIVLGKNKRLAFSDKASRYLKKKHITARVLPAAEAVKAYNACDERKAIFFYL